MIQQANGKPSRALLGGEVTLQQEMDDGDRIDAAVNVDYDMKKVNHGVYRQRGDQTIARQHQW